MTAMSNFHKALQRLQRALPCLTRQNSHFFHLNQSRNAPKQTTADYLVPRCHPPAAAPARRLPALRPRAGGAAGSAPHDWDLPAQPGPPLLAAVRRARDYSSRRAPRPPGTTTPRVPSPSFSERGERPGKEPGSGGGVQLRARPGPAVSGAVCALWRRARPRCCAAQRGAPAGAPRPAPAAGGPGSRGRR